MFKFVKKNNDLPRKSRMFAGIFYARYRGSWPSAGNATTMYLIRLRDFIEIVRVRSGTKKEKHY